MRMWQSSSCLKPGLKFDFVTKIGLLSLILPQYFAFPKKSPNITELTIVIQDVLILKVFLLSRYHQGAFQLVLFSARCLSDREPIAKSIDHVFH